MDTWHSHSGNQLLGESPHKKYKSYEKLDVTKIQELFIGYYTEQRDRNLVV